MKSSISKLIVQVFYTYFTLQSTITKLIVLFENVFFKKIVRYAENIKIKSTISKIFVLSKWAQNPIIFSILICIFTS